MAIVFLGIELAKNMLALHHRHGAYARRTSCQCRLKNHEKSIT